MSNEPMVWGEEGDEPKAVAAPSRVVGVLQFRGEGAGSLWVHRMDPPAAGSERGEVTTLYELEWGEGQPIDWVLRKMEELDARFAGAALRLTWDVEGATLEQLEWLREESVVIGRVVE